MTTNVFKETINSEEQFPTEKKARETFKTLRDLRSKHPKCFPGAS